jgi:hypothetical protein
MSAEYFSTGTVGQTTNTTRQIEQKILTALNNGGGSTGGVSQIVAGTNVTVSPAGGTGAVTVNATGGSSGTFSGTGSPQGAQVGSPSNTYLDTSGNHFWVKATGTGTNTGWVEIVA